jgi:hypothetical protein
MLAETDISIAKKHSDQRRYKHITDIPVEDYPNIDTVYIFDIDILINKKHIHHNIFVKLINIQYLYIEEGIDVGILNKKKLIKEILNFNKLKVFTQLFNKNPNLNTFTVDKNKMLIVTSNGILPSIPKKINYLQIINKNDLSLSNLPENIEYLKFNIINIPDAKISNLPIGLKSLTIYYEKNKDKKILSKIKLPHGCVLVLENFCII